MHADEPAGQGKGIDGIILEYEKAELLTVVGAIGGEPVAQRLNVILHLDILDHLAAGAYVAHDFAADPMLFLWRKHGLGGIAQIRQTISDSQRSQQQAQHKEVNYSHACYDIPNIN